MLGPSKREHLHMTKTSLCCYAVGWSGNRPGIHLEAKAAGKTSTSGARVLSALSTLRSESAATTRLACRSVVPSNPATSPRGSSPRYRMASSTCPALWRQLDGLNFFVCPLQDAPSQPVRLDQLLHEAHLVKARVEVELRKSGERLLAQRAPSIEIVSSLLVARREVPFVRRLVSGGASLLLVASAPSGRALPLGLQPFPCQPLSWEECHAGGSIGMPWNRRKSARKGVYHRSAVPETLRGDGRRGWHQHICRGHSAHSVDIGRCHQKQHGAQM